MEILGQKLVRPLLRSCAMRPGDDDQLVYLQIIGQGLKFICYLGGESHYSKTPKSSAICLQATYWVTLPSSPAR